MKEAHSVERWVKGSKGHWASSNVLFSLDLWKVVMGEDITWGDVTWLMGKGVLYVCMYVWMFFVYVHVFVLHMPHLKGMWRKNLQDSLHKICQDCRHCNCTCYTRIRHYPSRSRPSLGTVFNINLSGLHLQRSLTFTWLYCNEYITIFPLQLEAWTCLTWVLALLVGFVTRAYAVTPAFLALTFVTITNPVAWTD